MLLYKFLFHATVVLHVINIIIALINIIIISIILPF